MERNLLDKCKIRQNGENTESAALLSFRVVWWIPSCFLELIGAESSESARNSDLLSFAWNRPECTESVGSADLSTNCTQL